VTIETLPATTQGSEEKRQLALLKAIGFDRVSPEERELGLNIANRYELDLLLKHLVIIDGRAYITRDGLLHVAHRSGVFDGIEVTPPVLEGGFWRSTATVWRKDMTRGFTYPGRYPEAGRNKAYAPEMAVKVAEVAALRRAFDVSAPTVEERWADDVQAHEASDPVAPKSLKERARAKVETLTADVAADDPLVVAANVVVDEDTKAAFEACPSVSPFTEGKTCPLPFGHGGPHGEANETWL